jgi:four helix bundle protein
MEAASGFERTLSTMSSPKELVILAQTYDLLTWLLPQCDRFPKSQRFVVTQRLQAAALDFQEAIFEANARTGVQRLEHLQAADAHLNKLRLYLRLSQLWGWLSSGQYEHVSRMVTQIGRLLGGWIKQTQSGSGRRSSAKAAAGNSNPH